jgi:RNA polymerase sigma factor (sigma-70 family)
LEETIVLTPGQVPDVIEVDEALGRLAVIDERKAKVVELRYFGGMSREEIGAVLGLTISTVKRDLRLAEAWLRRYLTPAKG